LRVFKTKWFVRYATQENIDDDSLIEAIQRVEQGLIDANLGGCLIKVRIARKGQGRSSGYRTLLAYKKNTRTVFLYGFSKKERENIGKDELASLKDIAASWIKASDKNINLSLSKGILKEVNYEKEIL